MWNLVVVTFLLLKTPPIQVMLISIVLCALQLTNIKFPHPVRVKILRPISLSLSIIYLIGVAVLSWNYTYPTQDPTLLTKFILLALPIYVSLLAIWKTWLVIEKPIKSKKNIKSRK